MSGFDGFSSALAEFFNLRLGHAQRFKGFDQLLNPFGGNVCVRLKCDLALVDSSLNHVPRNHRQYAGTQAASALVSDQFINVAGVFQLVASLLRMANVRYRERDFTAGICFYAPCEGPGPRVFALISHLTDAQM